MTLSPSDPQVTRLHAVNSFQPLIPIASTAIRSDINNFNSMIYPLEMNVYELKSKILNTF